MKALGRGSIAAYIKIGLDVAAVLFWIAALGIGLAAIAYGGLLLAVHGGLMAASIFSTGAANQSGNVRYNLTVDPWQVAVPGLLGALVIVTGGLIVIRRLKALFQSFSSGEPFQKGNAGHLRAIWIALIGIELGRIAVAGLTGILVMALGQPADAHIKVGMKIDLMAWFTIAIVVVLAEVFREGARLKEEQELTI